MTLLLIYGFLAIGVSFVCSLLEACLLSLPRSYVELMVENGSGSGKILQSMKDNIDRPLAAILTLNTIAHTVGAIGVGAQAAIVFGSAAVGVASAVLTLLVLVISEILPKTLGTTYSKAIAAPAAHAIRLLTLIGLPLIIPLEWLNNLLKKGRQEDILSRAELLTLLRMGKTSGALRNREYQVISNLIALPEIKLSEITTPRTVIFSLPEEMTVREALDKHYPIRFARIPVYSNEPESISGYVARFSIHEALSKGEEHKKLQQLKRPIEVFPEHARLDKVLEKMIRESRHIALVVDEYGGVAGIATLEDMMESMLGSEIVDETDTVEDMRELARRKTRKPYS